MPRHQTTGRSAMPDIPGMYYDPERNRYFKGTAPKAPSPKALPLPSISIPRLLHSTTIGQSTSPSHLHAALLTRPPAIAPITHVTRPRANRTDTSHPMFHFYPPPDTLACRLSGSSHISLLTFPNVIRHSFPTHEDLSLPAVVSHGTSVAYPTPEVVFHHQIIDRQWFSRGYNLKNTRAVALTSTHLLLAGQSTRLYPISQNTAVSPCVPQALLYDTSADALSCDVDDCVRYAYGKRNGNVVIRDCNGLCETFCPSGAQRSVSTVKVRGNLIWCGTMRGGTNLTAWDVRDLSAPAIVCKGHSNVCKSLGLDAAGSLVIAAGDDEKVRVWDIRGGGVLSEMGVEGIVSTVKMVGLSGAVTGACGVWLSTGSQVCARILAT